MSLVGPRPALPHEDAHFDPELQRRHQMRPGITGLWQAEARDNPAFSAYHRLDLFYVDNWSLGLDLAILANTAHAVAVRAFKAVVPSVARRAAQLRPEDLRTSLTDSGAGRRRSRELRMNSANQGPNPDHRPEPPGSVRSAGVAGVSDLAGCRIPGGRGMPQGARAIPAMPWWTEWSCSSTGPTPPAAESLVLPRVPLLVRGHACGWPSGRDAAGASPPSRAATHPISSGRSACSSAGCMDPASSSTTTTCARRPTRAAFPDGLAAAPPGSTLPGAPDGPRRGPRHLDERLLSSRRDGAARSAARPRHRGSDRSRSSPARSPWAQTRACGEAATTWSPTSASWVRRMASTSSSRWPTSSSTSNSARTSALR